jgi:riboflavin-specific deaminase-like protein
LWLAGGPKTQARSTLPCEVIRRLFPAGGQVVEDLVAFALDEHRPGGHHLMLNMVTSLDGATSVGGEATPLGDDDDRALFRALRAACDVILVGAGTVRAEDYGPVRLPAEAVEARQSRHLPPAPRLAIVSRSLDLDPAARVFSNPERRPYIITGEDAPPARRQVLAERAEIVVAGESGADPKSITEALHDKGHAVILCEGGPTLNSQFIASGLVDELNLTVSPLIVGGSSFRLTHGAPEVQHDYRLDRLMTGDRMLFGRYLRVGR